MRIASKIFSSEANHDDSTVLGCSWIVLTETAIMAQFCNFGLAPCRLWFKLMSRVDGGLNEEARRHPIGCSSARLAFDARARFEVFSLGPKRASPPSNRIRGAEDRIVDPHVVA